MPLLRVVIPGVETPYDISLPGHASVQDLSAAVFASTDEKLSHSAHRLRFIVAGKNLSPCAPTLEHAGLRDGTFVHCAVSDITTLREESTTLSNDPLCEYDDGLVTIDLGEIPPVDMEMDMEMLSDEGALHDWYWGFLLATLLGVIMTIVAMDRSIALSSKWKRGIKLGTMVNLLFGLGLLATGRLS